MLLRQVADDVLAQYAYLIGCQRTGEAIVIDPERDVDRYVALAEAEGLRITAVTETHIHADFLSGARELAARGARVYLSTEGGPDWQYAWPGDTGTPVTWLRDGDRVPVGQIELRVVHTPGHTPEHIGFLVIDHGGGADVPMGLASGDFLFVGDVGRPDLLESAAGQMGMMRPSAERLGASLRALAGEDDALQIWPGHGAGSACGKALGAVPTSTLGYERRFNSALRLAVEAPDRFADGILEGQPEPPLYFAAMKRINKVGPPLLGAVPQPARLSGEALVQAARQRETVVVDTRRDRLAFMRRHLSGALFAPLDRTFATVLGSLARPEDALVLLVAPESVDPAVRLCIRIGFDRIAGWAPPESLATLPPDALDSLPTIDFRALAGTAGLQVVDVRSAREFADGHLAAAINIPHTRLLARLDELGHERPLAVHCLSGARAASAASALAREGFDVVYVNDHWPSDE